MTFGLELGVTISYVLASSKISLSLCVSIYNQPCWPNFVTSLDPESHLLTLVPPDKLRSEG